MTDATDLPPEEPFEGEDVPDEQLVGPGSGNGDGDGDEDEGLLDRLRGSGVGTEDPNIVGDVGPTDIPPGADPAA